VNYLDYILSKMYSFAGFDYYELRGLDQEDVPLIESGKDEFVKWLTNYFWKNKESRRIILGKVRTKKDCEFAAKEFLRINGANFKG